MKTNYSVTNGGFGSDFGDLFLPRELFSQGGLWTWGYNVNGQLGINQSGSRSSPVQTISSGSNWKLIACGNNFTAAIKTDGTLWTWGNNSNGNLGTNDITARSSPVQTIASGTNWKLVDCGRYHTAAIKTDGTLWTWGDNYYGSLGDNTINDRSSPVQTVSGGSNWKLIACGQYHTAAIKTDGTLWTWGSNTYGALGNGIDRNHRSSPVQTISGGTNWKTVTGGSGYTAAIKTDGTLWTWGDNLYLALGINQSGNRSSPVQTISGGTDWKSVASNGDHTVAIKTDGTLWAWGRNDYGQLGNNTTTNQGSPVQTVSGGTNWKQVAVGNHTAAIKTDGTLWTWGYNVNGQLGNNNPTYQSSPVQTVAGGTNWKTVACGWQHTAAITDIF